MQYNLEAKGGRPICILSNSICIMFEHVRLRHKGRITVYYYQTNTNVL